MITATSGQEKLTNGKDIEPSNICRVGQTRTLAIRLALQRKSRDSGTYFYDAQGEQSQRQPPHVYSRITT